MEIGYRIILLYGVNHTFIVNVLHMENFLGRRFRMPLSLQSYFFLDASQFQKERVFFERSWIFVAHESEFDFHTTIAKQAVGYPIVLTKDEHDQIRCFTNICRHRGTSLLQKGEKRNCSTIRCPYHAWGYGLDGRLTHTPNFGQALNMGDYHLSDWHVHRVQGLIFVSLDPKETFEEQMGDSIAEIQNMPRYVVRHEKEFLMNCNWKLYVENYLEGYHIPFVHPDLAKEIVMSNYKVQNHQRYISHHVDTKENAVAEGFWFYVWPNLAINSYQNGFSLERIIPISPSQSKISYLYLFSETCSEADIAKTLESSSKTTAEDIEIVEQIQKNIETGLYIPGPLSPLHETGIATFHEWLRQEDLL